MKKILSIKLLNAILLMLSVSALLSCTQKKINPADGINDAAAHWVQADRLIWDIPDSVDSLEIRFSQDADIKVSSGSVEGGIVIGIDKQVELNPQLSDKYRHISDRKTFNVMADKNNISNAIKGQVIALAYDKNGVVVEATKVQLAGVIDQNFTYSGSLGPQYNDEGIQLQVWAPTAQNVALKLYDKEKNELETLQADTSLIENGVWSFNGPKNWDRLFYRFVVTVFHPETNTIEEFEVTDPYSVSLSTDSYFSQFADLINDRRLKPSGWDAIKKKLPVHTDITLYEAHVRDFSIADKSIPELNRGTYKAFTYNGRQGSNLSNGMAHLKRLSDAGLTHLHLLPVNDIATVIENKELRVDLHHSFERICELIDYEELKEDCENYKGQTIREVFGGWASEDPVTDNIQRPYDLPGRNNGMAVKDGFNWGYDPFHFNAPEGSYATSPEGVTRILELREMVKSLHEIGLHIVIDVVYNHTFASGASRFSVLDKIVPGYYQRYDPTSGAIETSTCCDNTAAEHVMMEKLILDSVVHWARHYKIDSFRFDLMGHHPKYVMENLTKKLAEYTLEEDGFDGENIYIYGEGWNFGEVADNRIFDQATQFMMGGTGIGNFNDRSRDAIRGGNFTDRGRFQGFANGQYLFPNEDNADDKDVQLNHLLDQADRIRVGMAGNLSTYEYINKSGDRVNGKHDWIGFALNPQESVNYIDKHDNETLWDNTQTKLPKDMSIDNRVRVHMLSQAFINFGQGIPFYQMGTDILRSKSLDRNSFDSGDWYNRVDFSLESHNWGIGLPPGWDNRNRWDEMREFLSNPNIKVEKTHMEKAHDMFLDQLRIRYSTPLLRLSSAKEIHKRLKYHNTGSNQIPGIIAMSISDGDCVDNSIDQNYDGILIIFNSHIDELSIQLNGFEDMRLHPIQETGADEVVRKTSVINNTFTIPGLTAAVFVKEEQTEQGEFPCNIME